MSQRIKPILMSVVVATLIGVLPGNAWGWGSAIRRFDDATNMGPNLHVDLFNQINWVSQTYTHYCAVGDDAKKTLINNNGNSQAAYFDTLNDNYATTTGFERADQIWAYLQGQFPTGVPTWVILNEMSRSLWDNEDRYRNWVRNVCQRLQNDYGRTVIILTPFVAPSTWIAQWTSLGQNAYIATECFLGGQEIASHGYSVSYCQGVYQATKNAFANVGVPGSKLMLIEHFGWSANGDGYGREGLSKANWANAIAARTQAARNVGFIGFYGYCWAKNPNNQPNFDVDQPYFADIYNNYTLP